MTLAIELKYEDNDEKWRNFAIVSHTALAITPITQSLFEYLIDSNEFPIDLLEGFIDAGATRFWEFTWLKDGYPAGLSIRRVMTLKSISQTRLVFHSADEIEIPV